MLVGPRCRWLPPPCSMAGPPSTARQPPSGTGGWQPHRPLPRSPSRPPHHRALAPTAPGPALQVGESPRLTAIAEMLEEAVQREHGRGTVLEARKNIFLVDSKARGGGGGLSACPDAPPARLPLQGVAALSCCSIKHRGGAGPASRRHPDRPPNRCPACRSGCRRCMRRHRALEGVPTPPTRPPACHPPQGLVVRDRSDAEHLEDHKLPYAQAGRVPRGPGRRGDGPGGGISTRTRRSSPQEAGPLAHARPACAVCPCSVGRPPPAGLAHRTLGADLLPCLGRCTCKVRSCCSHPAGAAHLRQPAGGGQADPAHCAHWAVGRDPATRVWQGGGGPEPHCPALRGTPSPACGPALAPALQPARRAASSSPRCRSPYLNLPP